RPEYHIHRYGYELDHWRVHAARRSARASEELDEITLLQGTIRAAAVRKILRIVPAARRRKISVNPDQVRGAGNDDPRDETGSHAVGGSVGSRGGERWK